MVTYDRTIISSSFRLNEEFSWRTVNSVSVQLMKVFFDFFVLSQKKKQQTVAITLLFFPNVYTYNDHFGEFEAI